MTRISMLLLAATLAFGGCSSPQTPDEAAQAEGVDGKEDSLRNHRFITCQQNTDCVAILKPGCCSNGWKVAVNRDHVAQYKAANACQQVHPICPLYVIDDTRVAECNATSHTCQMVQKTCLDVVYCIQGTHWDSTQCKCVAN
jgi:hypothetical protein